MDIITKLNVRQKVMLALTILAAVFLVWQIVSFIRSGHASAPAAKTAQAPLSSAPRAIAAAPRAAPAANPPHANPVLAAQQREYLNLVRQYQVTKMKRQIVEEQASLANAQKRISATGVGIGQDFGGSAFVSGGSTVGNYQLAYVDRQAGHWLATLVQGDTYKEVTVGSRLSDGSRVASITSNTVILARPQGKNKVLTFQTSDNIVNPAAAAAAAAAESDTAVSPAQSKTTATTPAATKPKKIAKTLGITAAPVPPAPVSAQPSAEDIPAAPLTSLPPPTSSAPAPQAAPAAPAPISEPITESQPVSVKTLREQQAAAQEQEELQAPVALEAQNDALSETAVPGQISLKQAQNLQATVLNQ